MTLKIYGIAAWRTIRVLWMAEELGIPYEHVAIHYRDDPDGPLGRNNPDFLRANPMGRIPAIDDDGFTLSESMAINLYLARKAGKLWPRSLQGEGLVYQWTLFAATEIDPQLGTWYLHTAYLPAEQRKPEVAAGAVPKVAQRFDALERAIGTRTWLADDTFTIGDLNLAAAMYRAPSFGLDRWPRTRAWLARCYDRPAAQAAVAEREAPAR